MNVPSPAPSLPLVDRLCALDAAGVLMAPGETAEEFELRAAELRAALPSFLPQDLPQVPEAEKEAACRTVDALYGISPGWVPGYCSTKETGRFSAGVLLICDDKAPLIYLAEAFLRRKSFRGYTCAETLAHEMVHAARLPWEGSVYEEFFPCQVHRSPFRRRAGNLFRAWYLPLLFFTGLTFGIFFYPLLLLPAGILLREIQIQLRFRAAAAALRAMGLRPMPVLLRLDDREIAALARGKTPAFLTEPDSPRRQLLYRRFAPEEKPPSASE